MPINFNYDSSGSDKVNSDIGKIGESLRKLKEESESTKRSLNRFFPGSAQFASIGAGMIGGQIGAAIAATGEEKDTASYLSNIAIGGIKGGLAGAGFGPMGALIGAAVGAGYEAIPKDLFNEDIMPIDELERTSISNLQEFQANIPNTVNDYYKNKMTFRNWARIGIQGAFIESTEELNMRQQREKVQEIISKSTEDQINYFGLKNRGGLTLQGLKEEQLYMNETFQNFIRE